MFIRRFYDDRLAQASYMIGCQRTGEAIVIDPARDIRQYVDAAPAEGLRITQVTETHIHADFVSGARELAHATGAQLMLSGEGGPDWQYTYAASDGAKLLHDRDVIVMGGVRLDAWHTPGHTPEHLAFIVTDLARSAEPVAMVSGDFVFVGDVGRPDLLELAANVSGNKEESAVRLFHSLKRLHSLPDHLQVWPGHGAGSACGKALGAMPTSTLGYERLTNWAFGVNMEPAFVTTVLDGQPTPPSYFARMKRVNRDGPPVLGARPGLPEVDRDAVTHGLKSGSVVLDVRPKAEQAAGHLAGTLGIPLIKSFTTWAGWLVPGDATVILIAGGADVAATARDALASIGIDNVIGYAGPSVISGPTVRTAQPGDINNAGAMQADGRHVLDIREANEYAAGHIPGAEHHPLGTLESSVANLDRSTPLAVHCQGGTRSAIGTSVLERMGFTDVIDLTAGFGGWRKE
ncbi:MAG: MBL fold metallo-hydrolase [Gemmatimonadales bacterium]|nr:MBL fold metallo-hydrolase [Gemmatimonadales bacterium]